jgi:tetratricopeptide (TPR) repeat protein
MIAGILLASLLAQSGYYTPEEAQSLFGQANDAYEREDYLGARVGFQKLLDHGFGGPDVLFNLGTTFLAQGDLGAAVLYLERARRAGSSAPDVEANLAVARSKQLDQVVGGSSDEPFVQRVVAATSADATAWLFLATWDLGLALFLLLRFVRSRPTLTAIAGMSIFALSLPIGLLVAAHVYVRETVSDAVVMAKTLPARELPKDTAKVSFEVHSGLKLRLLERSGKFVKVRLPNGLEGWTEQNGVAEI